jgi:hypothetical protein
MIWQIDGRQHLGGFRYKIQKRLCKGKTVSMLKQRLFLVIRSILLMPMILYLQGSGYGVLFVTLIVSTRLLNKSVTFRNLQCSLKYTVTSHSDLLIPLRTSTNPEFAGRLFGGALFGGALFGGAFT